MPCWYYDEEALHKTPSIQDGVTFENECQFRKEGARLILGIGTKMDLGYNTMATGVVYFHRFYMFHSFKTFHQYVTACCCLFLAGKAEETPKKCKDIIKIAKKLLNVEEFTPFGQDPKEEVMIIERVLLQTIKFDLKVQHPYTYLLRYAKCIRGDKHSRRRLQKMVQMAWTFINDSLCTTLAIQWEPEIIAISVLYLAEKLSRFKIVNWGGRKPHHLKWWDVFVEDLPMSVIEDICHQILDLYSPRKLKKEQSDYSTIDPEITNENYEIEPVVSEGAVCKIQSIPCKSEPHQLQSPVYEKKINQITPLVCKTEVCSTPLGASANIICTVPSVIFENDTFQLEQATYKNENYQFISSVHTNENCQLQILEQVNKNCNLLTYACMDRNCNIKPVICKNETCKLQLIKWRNALCKEQKLVPVKYPTNPFLQKSNSIISNLEHNFTANPISLRDPRRDSSIILGNDKSPFVTQYIQETPVSPSSPLNFNFIRPRSPEQHLEPFPMTSIDPRILYKNFDLKNGRDIRCVIDNREFEFSENIKYFLGNNKDFDPPRDDGDFDEPENYRCSDVFKCRKGFNFQRNSKVSDDMDKDFNKSENERSVGYHKNKSFNHIENLCKLENDRGFEHHKNNKGFNTSEQRRFNLQNNNRGFGPIRSKSFRSREYSRKFEVLGNKYFVSQNKNKNCEDLGETGWDSKDKGFSLARNKGFDNLEDTSWNSRGRSFASRYNNRNYDAEDEKGFGLIEDNKKFYAPKRKGFGSRENKRGFGPIRNRGFGSRDNNRSLNSGRRKSFDSSDGRDFNLQRRNRGFNNSNERTGFSNSYENKDFNNFGDSINYYSNNKHYDDINDNFDSKSHNRFEVSENWDEDENFNGNIVEKEVSKMLDLISAKFKFENNQRNDNFENWDADKNFNNNFSEKKVTKKSDLTNVKLENNHRTEESENWDDDENCHNANEEEISKKLSQTNTKCKSENYDKIEDSKNWNEDKSFDFNVGNEEFSKKQNFNDIDINATKFIKKEFNAFNEFLNDINENLEDCKCRNDESKYADKEKEKVEENENKSDPSNYVIS